MASNINMHTEDDTLTDVFIEPDDLLTILIRYGNKQVESTYYRDK